MLLVNWVKEESNAHQENSESLSHIITCPANQVHNNGWINNKELHCICRVLRCKFLPVLYISTMFPSQIQVCHNFHSASAASGKWMESHLKCSTSKYHIMGWVIQIHGWICLVYEFHSGHQRVIPHPGMETIFPERETNVLHGTYKVIFLRSSKYILLFIFHCVNYAFWSYIHPNECLQDTIPVTHH